MNKDNPISIQDCQVIHKLYLKIQNDLNNKNHIY